MEIGSYVVGIITTIVMIIVAIAVKLDWKGIITKWIESKFQKDIEEYKNELKKENDKYNSELKEQNDLYNHELIKMRDEYKNELDKIATINKASVDNKLYRTKLLFDIEIELLREISRLMSNMLGDILKVTYLDTNKYLVRDQSHFVELKSNIEKSSASITEILIYKNQNLGFIPNEISVELERIICKSQATVGLSIKFLLEYIDNGFNNLDEIDVWFEVSNQLENVYHYSGVDENRRKKILKLGSPFENDMPVIYGLDMINSQIREYISKLTIVD